MLRPTASTWLFFNLQTEPPPRHIKLLIDTMDDSKDGTFDGKEIDKLIETLQVGESLLINACFVRMHARVHMHLYRLLILATNIFRLIHLVLSAINWGLVLRFEVYCPNRSQWLCCTPHVHLRIHAIKFSMWAFCYVIGHSLTEIKRRSKFWRHITTLDRRTRMQKFRIKSASNLTRLSRAFLNWIWTTASQSKL